MKEDHMSNDEVGRRGILKLFGSVPLAAGFALTGAQAQAAHQHAREEAKAGKAGPYTTKFFSTHEWATVRVLVDIVIPRDERSGSATDAQVPEFMDFILNDPLAEARQRERNQTQMRGGLAWLDRECARRFDGRSFLQASEAELKQVLHNIAYPPRSEPGREPTAAFPVEAYPKKTDVIAPEPSAGPSPAPKAAAKPMEPLHHGIA